MRPKELARFLVNSVGWRSQIDGHPLRHDYLILSRGLRAPPPFLVPNECQVLGAAGDSWGPHAQEPRAVKSLGRRDFASLL
jgi:hypothetical protein